MEIIDALVPGIASLSLGERLPAFVRLVQSAFNDFSGAQRFEALKMVATGLEHLRPEERMAGYGELLSSCQGLKVPRALSNMLTHILLESVEETSLGAHSLFFPWPCPSSSTLQTYLGVCQSLARARLPAALGFVTLHIATCCDATPDQQENLLRRAIGLTDRLPAAERRAFLSSLFEGVMARTRVSGERVNETALLLNVIPLQDPEYVAALMAAIGD